MLKDNFFTIENQDVEAGRFDVRLNVQHPIFAGHFPGDPITPGVCILQIACELMSLVAQRDLLTTSLKNAKFMQVIRPLENPVVTFQLDWQLLEAQNDFQVKCVVSHNETQFAKINFTVS